MTPVWWNTIGFILTIVAMTMDKWVPHVKKLLKFMKENLNRNEDEEPKA